MDPSLVQKLVKKAKIACNRSYSPYSGYRVGAAVLSDGRIFSGSSVENASFPAGVCAERIAIGAAITGGHSIIEAIAIVGHAVEGNFVDVPAWPCGICRQWLVELAPDSRVIIVDNDQISEVGSIDLLPRSFNVGGRAASNQQ